MKDVNTLSPFVSETELCVTARACPHGRLYQTLKHRRGLTFGHLRGPVDAAGGGGRSIACARQALEMTQQLFVPPLSGTECVSHFFVAVVFL